MVTSLIDDGSFNNTCLSAPNKYSEQPDQSEYNKGLISTYELSVKTDANTVNQIIATGKFSNIKHNPILQSVYFSPVTARYLVLKAIRMVNDNEPMGLAEIGSE